MNYDECKKHDCGKKKCYKCRQFITASITFNGTCTEDKLPEGIIIVGTFNLVKEWGVVFEFTNGNWVAMPQTEDFFFICGSDDSIWFTKPKKPSRNVIDVFCAREWDTLFDCENGKFYVLMCKKVSNNELVEHDECYKCTKKQLVWKLECTLMKSGSVFKCEKIVPGRYVVQTLAELNVIVGVPGEFGLVIDTGLVYFWNPDGNFWDLANIFTPFVFSVPDEGSNVCMWWVDGETVPAVTFSVFCDLSPGALLFDTIEGALWEFIEECLWEKQCQMLPAPNFLSVSGSGTQVLNIDGTPTVIELDTFENPTSIFSWSSAGPGLYVCPSSGIYKISYTICVFTDTGTGPSGDNIIPEFRINSNTSSGVTNQTILAHPLEDNPNETWGSTGFANLQISDTLSLEVNRSSINLNVEVLRQYTNLNAFKVKNTD